MLYLLPKYGGGWDLREDYGSGTRRVNVFASYEAAAGYVAAEFPRRIVKVLRRSGVSKLDRWLVRIGYSLPELHWEAT